MSFANHYLTKIGKIGQISPFFTGIKKKEKEKFLSVQELRHRSRRLQDVERSFVIPQYGRNSFLHG
ncbi:MAG: hypothetical protein PHX26_09070 [Proteiniphilum sp.]|nr:hypothetical protein [Proteiniphilum sp.]